MPHVECRTPVVSFEIVAVGGKCPDSVRVAKCSAESVIYEKRNARTETII